MIRRAKAAAIFTTTQLAVAGLAAGRGRPWMLRRNVTAAVLAGLLVGGVVSGAHAQQPTTSSQPVASASGWTFDLTPYVWFATINTGMNLNLPPALGGSVSTDTSV